MALLIGCAAAPDVSSPLALPDRQQQFQHAAAIATAAGDFRPYPDGWPNDALPLHREPEIIQSIQLGQTMSEVTKVIGREGWSHADSPSDFLKELHKCYEQLRSSYRVPQDLGGIAERLPTQGRFVSWQYQGFPGTADWIVIFFAPPLEAPDSEPRVVARGVFGLGDF